MSQKNILSMLQTEHRKVAQLFKDLEETTARGPGRRKEIFCGIDDSLSVHADFEEREVYPLMGETKESKSIAQEALEEHLQFKRLLAEIRDIDPQDERWMSKAQVLMDDVRHHIEEEEDEAFPQLRKDVSARILQRLAHEYKVLKQQAEQKDPAAATERSDSANTRPRKAKQSKVRQTKKQDDDKVIDEKAEEKAGVVDD